MVGSGRHGAALGATLAGMTTDYLTRAELRRSGLTRRSIQDAVRSGALIHVRRDRYLTVQADDMYVRAVRVGGRLTCLSLLGSLGVFVLENRALHVHIDPRGSRLRDPADRRRRLRLAAAEISLHWSALLEPVGQACTVSVVDAAAHAIRCQPPRAAVATLDSLLNRGLLTRFDLRRIFAALPARFAVLEHLVDPRAESGPETFVRLLARSLGCEIALQVRFDGIGRVDLVLDGWLVVECDSKEFHSDWAQQARDRERDAALAALGYTSLRFTAAMVMYRPDDVLAALRGLLAAHRTH